MKQLILATIVSLMTLTSSAQQKKDLVISVAAGTMTSPYYSESKAGHFYNIDFDYHLSKRQVLSANYNTGAHNYYDNILATDPAFLKSDGTNAKASYRTFSVLYKYVFLDKKAISASLGSGVGVMTHSREYPYTLSNGSSFMETSWSDLVFPVKLQLEYKMSKSISLGLTGGFYIAPDYPILAYHIGPKLSYLIK